MSRNHIGKLPTEIHLLILLQLPTIQELYSLIRASLQHYQVFLTWKEEILCTVVSRILGPDVLVDAVAAVEASVHTLVMLIGQRY